MVPSQQKHVFHSLPRPVLPLFSQGQLASTQNIVQAPHRCFLDCLLLRYESIERKKTCISTVALH